MQIDKLRIALRNVQRTLTRTQAVWIARAVLRRAIATSNQSEAVCLGLLVRKGLESIPESELPTQKQFERLERLTRARARKA